MDLLLSLRRLAPLAVTAALLLAGRARADLFSPGELAKQHQNLSGMSNCTQCHPAGGQLSADKCLDCHTELKPEVQAGRGYHGHLSAEQKTKCETCHHEHQGVTFALVNWGKGGKKAFEHARTGWPLEGGHAPVECEKCHEPRFQSAAIKALLQKQPGRESYLGTPTACAACHFDEHRGQLGNECQSCHVVKAWKPAPSFDHGTLEFPLEGKHKKVACEKCHPSQNGTEAKGTFPAPKHETFAKYNGLDFKKCTDCHKDPHDNKFGQRCTSCHTVDGWLIIRNAAQERSFHDKTRFPLKGEHLDAPCKSCHGPLPGMPVKFKGLPFDTCATCHADAHEGQLGPVKCETCHTVDGFSPPRFELAQHQKTSFPLEGAHQLVGCRGCHPASPAVLAKVPAALKLKLTRQRRPLLVSAALFDVGKKPEACESCHQDVHQGQFEKKACSTCHDVQAFQTVKFDHQKDSRFHLDGAHAKVTCAKCHGPDARGVVRYKPLSLQCNACHADVHAGQFSAAGALAACEKCHTVEAFKPAVAFEHAPPFTTFELDGAHQKVACGKCHPAVKTKGVEVVRYRPLPRTCEGCHSDFHHGAFEGFTP